MGRIDKAGKLLTASWGVLRETKQLLILPMLSGICALVVIASFAYPVYAVIDIVNPQNAESIEVPVAAYVLVFFGYLMVTFVGMFFNAALVFAANEHMDGGEPTLTSALKGAAERAGRIFVWALVASTVSVLISQLQQRLGIFGKILGFLAGTAWAVVTFLVLPILVIENLGPMDAAQRSATLLKRSWGEGLAGHIGLGLVNLLIGASLLVIIIGTAMIYPVLLLAVLPLALLCLLTAFVVMSAMSSVFQTALYRHAAGLPTGGFDEQLMAHAFTHKKGHKPPRLQTPPGAPSQGMIPTIHNPDAPPPMDLEAPQDWSKLPDGWDTGGN